MTVVLATWTGTDRVPPPRVTWPLPIAVGLGTTSVPALIFTPPLRLLVADGNVRVPPPNLGQTAIGPGRHARAERRGRDHVVTTGVDCAASCTNGEVGQAGDKVGRRRSDVEGPAVERERAGARTAADLSSTKRSTGEVVGSGRTDALAERDVVDVGGGGLSASFR